MEESPVTRPRSALLQPRKLRMRSYCGMSRTLKGLSSLTTAITLCNSTYRLRTTFSPSGNTSIQADCEWLDLEKASSSTATAPSSTPVRSPLAPEHSWAQIVPSILAPIRWIHSFATVSMARSWAPQLPLVKTAGSGVMRLCCPASPSGEA